MAGRRPWTIPSYPCEFKDSGDHFTTCLTCWSCSKSIDELKSACEQYDWKKHQQEQDDLA